jgi:two-component system, chemotaxis family, sensor kinase Cph1
MSAPASPAPQAHSIGDSASPQNLMAQDAYDAESLYQTHLVQPHGCLIAFQGQIGRILQISENAAAFFGVEAIALIGQSLQSYLPTKVWKTLQPLISAQVSSLAPFRFNLNTAQGKQAIQAIAHRPMTPEVTPEATAEGLAEGLAETTASPESIVILELEAIAPEANLDLVQMLQFAALHQGRSEEIEPFLQQAAIAIHQVTGYDRVMVYRFDEFQAGCVIAEVKPADQPTYLHHWYPSEDIPDPVRKFYAQGGVRYVPDLVAPPVCLTPPENPVTGKRLDLTRSVLRAVDPCCVEFHGTMKVQALIVIALMKADQLWGLITCHHPTPRCLPYEVRFACAVIGQLTSAEIARRVHQVELQTALAERKLQAGFISAIAQAKDLKTALTYPDPQILDLAHAQGAAICLGDEITLRGQTPTQEQVEALLAWMNDQFQTSLFHSSNLAQIYPPASEFSAQASGVLALCISQVQRYFILWFRAEVLQTITWAGNPEPTYATLADGNRKRSPRQSFQQWQETVRATSAPWQTADLENVLALRNAIVGMVLKTTDDLTKLNLELQRSNQELESFAYIASHDLKEPLRGIYNSTTFLLEDYGNLLDQGGLDRLGNMMRLTHRLENLIDALLQFSRLGQMELVIQPTDLQEILVQEMAIVRESQTTDCPEVIVPRPLPTVPCGSTLVAQIYRNLLSNAFKYSDKAKAAWVEVGYFTLAEIRADPEILSTCRDARSQLEARAFDKPEEPLYVFYVKDNGIGIRDRHLETVFRLFKRLHPPNLYQGGTGTGLTIVKKMIERHHGKIWVESTLGAGTAFYFTLGGG